MKHNHHWYKTHQRLQLIVLSEMKTKPMRSITVSSVCRIANINRSTFYEHYEDIIDLIDKTIQKQDEKLMEDFKRICQHKSYRFLNQQFIEAFLKFIKAHGEFYKLRIHDEKQLFYAEGIYKLFKELKNQNDAQINIKRLQYYLVAFKATFINITNEWARHNYHDSVNEIAQIIMSASPQILFDAEPQIFF